MRLGLNPTLRPFLSMGTLCPALSCSVSHAFQAWPYSFVCMIIEAGEFANVGMITINILVVFTLTTKSC